MIGVIELLLQTRILELQLLAVFLCVLHRFLQCGKGAENVLRLLHVPDGGMRIGLLGSNMLDQLVEQLSRLHPFQIALSILERSVGRDEHIHDSRRLIGRLDSQMLRFDVVHLKKKCLAGKVIGTKI